MNKLFLERSIYVLAILGAITAFTLLGTALITKVSQEPFQAVRPVAEYTDLLKTQAGPLRLVFTLDNFFIIFYTAFFVLFATALREKGPRAIISLALGSILLAGLLDGIENFHILTMLASSTRGLPLEISEIQTQMIVTQVKFLSSYLGLFLFAFTLPGQTVWERTLMRLFWFVQLPIGILAFTAPVSFIKPLVIGRGIFFIVAFLIVFKIFKDRARETAKIIAA